MAEVKPQVRQVATLNNIGDRKEHAPNVGNAASNNPGNANTITKENNEPFHDCSSVCLDCDIFDSQSNSVNKGQNNSVGKPHATNTVQSILKTKIWDTPTRNKLTGSNVRNTPLKSVCRVAKRPLNVRMTPVLDPNLLDTSTIKKPEGKPGRSEKQLKTGEVKPLHHVPYSRSLNSVPKESKKLTVSSNNVSPFKDIQTVSMDSSVRNSSSRTILYSGAGLVSTDEEETTEIFSHPQKGFRVPRRTAVSSCSAFQTLPFSRRNNNCATSKNNLDQRDLSPSSSICRSSKTRVTAPRKRFSSVSSVLSGGTPVAYENVEIHFVAPH